MFGITRNKYFVGSVINLGKADGVRDKTRLPSQGRFCNLQMSKGIIPCFSPLVQAEWKQIGVNSAPQIVGNIIRELADITSQVAGQSRCV